MLGSCVLQGGVGGALITQIKWVESVMGGDIGEMDQVIYMDMKCEKCAPLLQSPLPHCPIPPLLLGKSIEMSYEYSHETAVWRSRIVLVTL